jgi:hypothetical protein
LSKLGLRRFTATRGTCCLQKKCQESRYIDPAVAQTYQSNNVDACDGTMCAKMCMRVNCTETKTFCYRQKEILWSISLWHTNSFVVPFIKWKETIMLKLEGLIDLPPYYTFSNISSVLMPYFPVQPRKCQFLNSVYLRCFACLVEDWLD